MVHLHFESWKSSAPSSLREERRMPVIGEDQKRAAKMIKDKEKLQYKEWPCMLWLCGLGKVTCGDVNSSTEKSGWGSASALFEWRSYGPPSKVLCSKQKEAVPNLVDFFLRWVQWHIPESEGYWLNKLIRCRKFPKMKNDWRLGEAQGSNTHLECAYASHGSLSPLLETATLG